MKSRLKQIILNGLFISASVISVISCGSGTGSDSIVNGDNPKEEKLSQPIVLSKEDEIDLTKTLYPLILLSSRYKIFRPIFL